jgi:hypothetical protein
MNQKLLVTLVIALAFILGTLCNFHVEANEADDFSTGTLDHGLQFQHYNIFAPIGTSNDPPNPRSVFEPGKIQLTGEFAELTINRGIVVTRPPELPEIPEATAENQVEVLNQIRQVLTDAKLAVEPPE